MPARTARAALTRRLRSSRMCSMSGIRPSGSFLEASSMRPPTTRAPVTVSASFGISGPRRVPGSDGLLVRRNRSRLLGRRFLKVFQLPDLLLQAVDLRLGAGRLLRAQGLVHGNWRGRRSGRDDRLRPYGLAVGFVDVVSGLLVGFVVVVQTRDLGLKDPHRPAERPGRDRQFPGPEEHDEHDGDNQDFPRTVKKVAYHFRPLWRGWSPPAVRAFHGRVYTSRPRHRETPAGRAVCRMVNIPVGTLL